MIRRYPQPWHVLLVGPLVLWAGGCNSDSREGDKASVEQAGAAELERIRSLGYVGYSSKKADPSQSGAVQHDPQLSWPGYNLYSDRDHCAAFLIDSSGKVINSWEDVDGRHWANCELLPNGDLLVVGKSVVVLRERTLSDRSRYLTRLSWTGDVIWKRSIMAHHDVEVTPHRHILTLTMGYRFEPKISRKLEIRDDQLTLLSGAGEVLERHSVYDLLASDPEQFAFQQVAPQQRENDPKIDLLHTNSVEWMCRPQLAATNPIYALSNVLFCMRQQDAIAIVNWDEKKLLWAWGQGELSGPHDATTLDNGNILLFDNGLNRSWSRILEVNPLTKQIVWEYRADVPEDFYSVSRGSAQRLPNGNTLIVDSDNGRAFEITSTGRTIWEFHNPHINEEGHRASIVRMKRYETAFVRRILAERSANSGAR